MKKVITILAVVCVLTTIATVVIVAATAFSDQNAPKVLTRDQIVEEEIALKESVMNQKGISKFTDDSEDDSASDGLQAKRDAWDAEEAKRDQNDKKAYQILKNYNENADIGDELTHSASEDFIIMEMMCELLADETTAEDEAEILQNYLRRRYSCLHGVADNPELKTLIESVVEYPYELP